MKNKVNNPPNPEDFRDDGEPNPMSPEEKQKIIEALKDINSFEDGKRILLNSKLSIDEIGLRNKIIGRMVEIANTEEDLEKIFNNEGLPASEAKTEALLKFIEISNNFEKLWEIAYKYKGNGKFEEYKGEKATIFDFAFEKMEGMELTEKQKKTLDLLRTE